MSLKVPSLSVLRMPKKRYSGRASIHFWDLIWVVTQKGKKFREMYDLGCDLQDLEGKVLKKLEDHLRKFRKKIKNPDDWSRVGRCPRCNLKTLMFGWGIKKCTRCGHTVKEKD